jgi:hypothetical protein
MWARGHGAGRIRGFETVGGLRVAGKIVQIRAGHSRERTRKRCEGYEERIKWTVRGAHQGRAKGK